MFGGIGGTPPGGAIIPGGIPGIPGRGGMGGIPGLGGNMCGGIPGGNGIPGGGIPGLRYLQVNSRAQKFC